MTLGDEGINRVRDLIAGDLYKGQKGTGTTVPTTSDTALESAVAATSKDLSYSLEDKQITITHEIPATDGNGNTLSEGNIELGDAGTQYQLIRYTHHGVIKSASDEQVTIVRLFLRNNG